MARLGIRTGLHISLHALFRCKTIRDVEKTLELLFNSIPLYETERPEGGILSFRDIELHQKVAFAPTDVPDDTSLLQLPMSGDAWDTLKWQRSKSQDSHGLRK